MSSTANLVSRAVAAAKDALPEAVTPVVLKAWTALVPRRLRKRYYNERRSTTLVVETSSASQVISDEPPAPDVSKKQSESRPLLTVIIPAYNVEEYLEQCINSVLTQSYRNLEVIIVVDGATDRTGAIADAYSRSDGRVTVIHQVNGGLSNARNSGMAAAHGEYLAFLDSDDWLPKDAYEKLMDSLASTGSSIATGNVMRAQGSRRWQAWNQMYTHAGLERVLTTTLAETPELVFDTVAWNKVYRKSLFEDNSILFPEGKLYEDMHPTSRAYIAADSVDIVPNTVYFYRVRDDKSSITQRRGELKNLRDKLEMIRRVEASLVDGNLPPEAVQTVIYKALEGDLSVYSPFLGQDPEFDESYLQALRHYWSAASAATISKLALDRRVLFSQQVEGNLKAAEISEAWVRNHFHEIPILSSEGRIDVDPTYNQAVLGALQAGRDTDMYRYIALNQAITDASFEKNELVVKGFAFLDYLPEEAESEILLELVSADGARIVLNHSSRHDERANGYWRSGYSLNSHRAFNVRVPAVDLFGPSPALGDWTLWVTVTSGIYSESVPATGFWRGGAARLGATAELWRGETVYIKWQPWNDPLTLRVIPEGPKIISVRESTSGSLHLEFHCTGAVTKATLERGKDSIAGVVESLGGGRYIAHVGGNSLKRERSADLGHGWKFKVRVDERWQSAVLHSQLGGGMDLASGLQLRTDTSGRAVLIDQASMLVVDAIEKTDEGWILLGGCHYGWPEELEISLESSAGKSYECESEFDESGRFKIVVSCDLNDRGQSWAAGEYRIKVMNSRWQKSASGVRAAVNCVESMPMERMSSTAATRWHAVSDTLEISLRVAAPRASNEQGRSNRERMIRAWRDRPDSEIAPLDAVLYVVDVGIGAGDSARAIMAELGSRYPNVVHYWAVEDGSVAVPDGAIPVVRDTEFWFQIVNSVRVVVNNYGGLLGYNARQFQYYVQTWHGTPLKTLGRTQHAQDDPRWRATKDERSRAEAAEWDLFVAQNQFMLQVAREEFYYEGEVIDSGYPRNDILARKRGSVDIEMRRTLGIGERERVVLYAPTWRDDGTGGYSQKLFDGLDLDSLVKKLGPGWTVLLRGHSFNRRARGKVGTRARILDVTDHADVNDLMRVADVLITDYSSIMFDFLVTRKPIMYFAPDLDHYLLTRGMYFNYEDVLAGPRVANVDELVSELRSLKHFDRRFGSLYQNQVDRFVPWDDGFAARRVVDRILEQVGEFGTVGGSR